MTGDGLSPLDLSAPPARTAMAVLWPSFLTALGAEFAFFAVFDPAELHVFGRPLALGAEALYTLGFFLFWAFGAATSGLTVYFQGRRRP